ncbi:hypothetical protein Dsin_021651 [Dipteronia sinensis]|uniref:Reverse transcriptase n=1 Tax=Dipteronia sinensis TaxID=43782 RepID=A0AAE0DZ83_9ROSI|nr:hypothetical protein Dsin_021651 [Dipteronia sinensis]
MVFVKNRQIIDSFAIANEIIHSWKSDSREGLVVKLDFEKAYDNVDHSFLDFVMELMGFGQQWRKWMFSCVSLTSLSVLVNGSLTEQYCIERGLRQNDPLSLFLFIMVVEALNCLIRKATELNFLRGIVFGSNETSALIRRRLKFLLSSLANGLKFNVISSVRGKPGPAGIGGVLRNSEGKILYLFSSYVGIEESNKTEILALHRAYELCASKDSLVGREIVFASHSKTDISWVSNFNSTGGCKHVKLIYDILSFLHYSGRSVVVYNHKSTNTLADELAKAD